MHTRSHLAVHQLKEQNDGRSWRTQVRSDGSKCQTPVISQLLRHLDSLSHHFHLRICSFIAALIQPRLAKATSRRVVARQRPASPPPVFAASPADFLKGRHRVPKEFPTRDLKKDPRRIFHRALTLCSLQEDPFRSLTTPRRVKSARELGTLSLPSTPRTVAVPGWCDRSSDPTCESDLARAASARN